MLTLKQNESTAARRRVFFNLVDGTDNKTAETGLTLSGSEIKVSKNGATAANMAGTAAEVSSMGGLYYYTLDATEVDTLGTVVLYINKSGCNAVHVPIQVIAADVYDAAALGLTNLANAVPSTSSIATGVLDAANGVETGVTLRQAMRYIGAMLAGKVTGAGTGSETFYAMGNPATARVIHTVDASKNRTSTTLA